ncbi:MAG: 2-hydroxy-3-oxopropionate reductase [Vicinamibacterales bacterium]
MSTATTPSIGFIGLGLMGKPMALNLRRAGFALDVMSRSPGPVDELVAAGARRATTAAELAARCDVIITMLPDSPDVQQVLAGPAGVFDGARAGTIVVDMSSISPVATRELAVEAGRRGLHLLDAPVSGGEIGARSATLSIMVGGDADVLERVRPVLEALGTRERIVHVGPSGAGQLCKVCNQLVIGGTLAAVSEAFALARKSGVDAAKVRQALLGGFAASRVLEVHGERMLQSNYVPGFRAEMYQKDLRIAVDTARAHSVPMPVTACVQQLLSALLAAGRGRDDYSALATVLFDLANLTD